MKSCPYCDNVGWFVVQGTDGEPEQQQCEFCYTEPDSVFNVVENLRSLVSELKQDAEGLAEKWVSIDDAYKSGYCCQHCAEETFSLEDGSGWKCEHSPDCPIELHRQLMARIEEK